MENESNERGRNKPSTTQLITREEEKEKKTELFHMIKEGLNRKYQQTYTFVVFITLK